MLAGSHQCQAAMNTNPIRGKVYHLGLDLAWAELSCWVSFFTAASQATLYYRKNRTKAVNGLGAASLVYTPFNLRNGHHRPAYVERSKI